MMDPTQSQAQVMGPSEGTAWENKKKQKTKTKKNEKPKTQNGADQTKPKHIYVLFFWSAQFFVVFSLCFFVVFVFF